MKVTEMSPQYRTKIMHYCFRRHWKRILVKRPATCDQENSLWLTYRRRKGQNESSWPRYQYQYTSTFTISVFNAGITVDLMLPYEEGLTFRSTVSLHYEFSVFRFFVKSPMRKMIFPEAGAGLYLF